MTTKEIADRLVALCRQGKFEDAQKELFAENVVSIEPYAQPGFDKETKGLPAIMEKGRRFMSTIEKVYSLSVSDPVVGGNAFACNMEMDVKMKGEDRMQMAEVCIYQVKDGKVISEEFRM